MKVSIAVGRRAFRQGGGASDAQDELVEVLDEASDSFAVAGKGKEGSEKPNDGRKEGRLTREEAPVPPPAATHRPTAPSRSPTPPQRFSTNTTRKTVVQSDLSLASADSYTRTDCSSPSPARRTLPCSLTQPKLLPTTFDVMLEAASPPDCPIDPSSVPMRLRGRNCAVARPSASREVPNSSGGGEVGGRRREERGQRREDCTGRRYRQGSRFVLAMLSS